MFVLGFFFVAVDSEALAEAFLAVGFFFFVVVDFVSLTASFFYLTGIVTSY